MCHQSSTPPVRVEGELAAPVSSLGRGGKLRKSEEGETGLEGRVEEENGRSEDRDREVAAGGGTEASLLGGEMKAKPGGGKADKGREER